MVSEFLDLMMLANKLKKKKEKANPKWRVKLQWQINTFRTSSIFVQAVQEHHRLFCFENEPGKSNTERQRCHELPWCF